MSEQQSPAIEEQAQTPAEENETPEQKQPAQQEDEQALETAALNRVVYAQAAYHLFNLLKDAGQSPIELLDQAYFSQEEASPAASPLSLEEIITWLQAKQLTNLQPKLIELTKNSLLSDFELKGQAAAIKQILDQYSEHD
jgi:hypothetical protein